MKKSVLICSAGLGLIAAAGAHAQETGRVISSTPIVQEVAVPRQVCNQQQNVQHCTTQTFHENRTVGYDVTYEYGGRQYTAQMASDPGLSVQLQISPVGAASAPPAAQPPAQAQQAEAYVPPQGPGIPILSSAPQYQYVQPAQQVVVVPNTVVYPSPYYYRPYYPPFGISLNLGYSRGYGYRGHRHGGRYR